MAAQDKENSKKLTKTVKQDVYLAYMGVIDFTNVSPQTIAALEQGKEILDAGLGNLISIRKQMPVVAASSILLGSLPQDIPLAKKLVEVLKKSDHEATLQQSEEKVHNKSNKR